MKYFMHEKRENWNSSVIRQKGESQNGYFKKTKHAFSEKQNFVLPDTHKCKCVSGGKK